MKNLFLILLLVLSLGCVQLTTEEATDDSADEATTAESTEPTSLEAEENGGYETEDEEPLFGLDSMEQYEEDGEVMETAPLAAPGSRSSAWMKGFSMENTSPAPRSTADSSRGSGKKAAC